MTYAEPRRKALLSRSLFEYYEQQHCAHLSDVVIALLFKFSRIVSSLFVKCIGNLGFIALDSGYVVADLRY